MTIFGINVDSRDAFNAAYWASQPPAVQALAALSGDARAVQAFALAQSGYVIDVPIMALGSDPYMLMYIRQNVDLQKWVPSGLQNQPDDPFAMQRLPIPAGALIVSTDPNDFPPFAAPAPVQPATTKSPVGPDMGFTFNGKEVFSASATDTRPGGSQFTDASGTYVKVPFGLNELMDTKHQFYVWLKN